MFPPESPLLVKRLKISNTPKFGTNSRIQFQCHFIGWPCAQLHKYPKAWSQVGARSFKTGWFNAYATFHLRLLTTSVNIRNAKYEYLTVGVSTFFTQACFPKTQTCLPLQRWHPWTDHSQWCSGRVWEIGPNWPLLVHGWLPFLVNSSVRVPSPGKIHPGPCHVGGGDLIVSRRQWISVVEGCLRGGVKQVNQLFPMIGGCGGGDD